MIELKGFVGTDYSDCFVDINKTSNNKGEENMKSRNKYLAEPLCKRHNLRCDILIPRNGSITANNSKTIFLLL
jgi:hypothetical protein